MMKPNRPTTTADLPPAHNRPLPKIMRNRSLIQRAGVGLPARLAAFALLICAGTPVLAQWPVGLGSTLADRANAVVTSPSGSVVMAGDFQGTISVGASNYISNGLSDGFVAKYSIAGGLQWVFTLGGVSEDSVRDVALDEQDNVYVTGTFAGNVNLGGTLLTSSDAFTDVFVAKFSSDGEFRWVRTLRGTKEDVASSIEVFAGSATTVPPTPPQVFVAGEFRDGLARGEAFGNNVFLSGSGSHRDVFVARLDGDGDWVWIRDNNSSRSNEDIGIREMTMDKFGQIYVSGDFANATSFGGDSISNINSAPGSAWTKQGYGPPTWQVVTSFPNTGFRSWYLANLVGITDRSIATPFVSFASTSGVLEFRHRYRFDWASNNGQCYDGAVLEYQLSGGSWHDINSNSGLNTSSNTPFPNSDQKFTAGAYNDNLVNAEGNPLGARSAWCDRNPTWPNYSTVSVNLSRFDGYGDVRFRLRFGAGSAVGDQGWWIDDIVIRDGSSVLFEDDLEQVPDTFVATLSGTLGGSPSWGWGLTVPSSVVVNDLAVDDGSALYLAGTADAATTFVSNPNVSIAEAGAFVAKIRDTGTEASWQWAIGVDGGNGTAVIADPTQIYLAGDFGEDAGDTISFVTSQTAQRTGSACSYAGGSETCSSVGGRDIFVAKIDDPLTGTWAWANSGGGPGDERAYDLATDQILNLHVAGSFHETVVFGDDEDVTSVGSSDALIASIDFAGLWFDILALTVGEPVPIPDGAEATQLALTPEFFFGDDQVLNALERYFRWSPPDANGGIASLVPLQPVAGIEIHWRVAGLDPEDKERIVKIANALYPTEACTQANQTACYQLHVAGAPVEITPDGLGLSFFDIKLPEAADASDASSSNGNFTAVDPGWSLITYVVGPTADSTQYPLNYEVVRTVGLQDQQVYHPQQPCEIGAEILDGYHDEPGRAGYVLFANAFYDATFGTYNRAAREGQILPVNRVSAARPQDAQKRMAVAWYRSNALGVYWPSKSSEYDCRWPVDPDKIIVASELGSEVLGQPLLTAANFPSRQLYQQPNPNLPGYNPNDEHALFAPSSNGSGIEALFALRSDFGSGLGNEASTASDPYALLKYFDVLNGKWRFKVYQVFATGAGYNAFQYSGIAGSPVNPPYPLSLLSSCAESQVVGEGPNDPQPPSPFFRDYSAKLWGKSADQGQVGYHYPMQPTFFYDIDAPTDSNDLAEFECVPWMPRLPESLGGTANTTQPILTTYNIAWPSDVPLLTVGETLLTPKRGLPDIYNQAAVQVVFDELQNAFPEDPRAVLAQIIDPLNPRSIRLEDSADNASTACDLTDLPADVGTEFDVDGNLILLGSADGTKKLPFALQTRLRYDPLNGKLIFSGLFDDGVAGEPLLLLNVMSKADRDTLKSISTDTDFGTCVDNLFRTSRNPAGISQICTDPGTDGNTGDAVCNSATVPVTDDDVLIGWQDTNNDGLLEPFQGVGIKAALTAGAAQGEGFLTLAFNNDASLAPSPVSLAIIRIGCLRTEDPPIIESTYQGQLQIIEAENVFDELITLRHSGDFGGDPDSLQFEWYFKPDEDGTPPFPLPNPEAGQLNGWFKEPVPAQGTNEINIGGANLKTLSDNWFIARYKGLGACQNQTQWSIYAGQPGATLLDPRAQLAEGWIKRVVRRLDPFEARVQDFHRNETNTYASMLVQLGERFEGPIALNSDPDNLNNIGLIEAYETVKRRGLSLSVDATPPVNYGPANNAILLVTSRISDFYMLLGNEAYADAQDPTVGITTGDAEFASFAPTIFNFQNQSDSLLEEELILLRGRDDSQGPVAASPVYNRYFWNFTSGEGEVAYSLSYNIADQNVDGVIDFRDARILFPQGHGDAWGHYLTAIKSYYSLLQHPFFTWIARAEAVTVASVPLQVDFLDERKFAQAAAARAKVGAEVTDLTYRSEYVADPSGQWQGYKDTDRERAWGLDGWARRAGQGAYFDWVTANSLLPAEDLDPEHVGIEKIDRKTVGDLADIVAQAELIQAQVDEADRGLNPLGLAEGVVPFDIDPSFLEVGSGVQGLTHFEQVYERAEVAMENAVAVWDFANQLTNMLRFNQDAIDDLTENNVDVEFDYEGRLIELLGTPYDDDIGAGGLYPAGYSGPDYYHYNYIELPEIFGTRLDQADLNVDESQLSIVNSTYAPAADGIGFFGDIATVENQCGGRFANYETATASGCPLGPTPDGSLTVSNAVWQTPNLELGYAVITPPSYQGRRRVVGELQSNLKGMATALLDLKTAIKEYDNLRLDIVCAVGTLETTYDVSAEKIEIMQNERRETNNYLASIAAMQATSIALRRAGEIVSVATKEISKCLPDQQIAGLAVSVPITPAKCAIAQAGAYAQFTLDTVADGVDIIGVSLEAAKEDVAFQSAIQTEILDSRLELFNQAGGIDQLIRQEPVQRANLYEKAAAVGSAESAYLNTLHEVVRLQEERGTYRKNTAAAVQEYRLEDFAFRVFRNDALQKYRASFDLAARYAYLAATAYDYETNLLGTDSQSGRDFLTAIVRERSLGQVLDGDLVPGSRGLADPLGRMEQNFGVLKTQMGFNNPQFETNRFSLRQEMFRIDGDDASDGAWRSALQDAWVDNLFDVPEFRRYARPFAPEALGPQPGLVIPFSTTVTFGLNYFGWPLGPGDSAYDPTQFSTRIRSAGVWFEEPDGGLPISNTPRVYLIPVGSDVLRSPTAGDFATREWEVVDQVLPLPFPIGANDLDDATWLPVADTLNGDFTQIRRHGSLRAYPFQEPVDDSQFTTDSRLIGRSVWNTRWLLVIPGGTLLNNGVEGLETFIYGPEDGLGGRTGAGIQDIRIFFSTYAYSGF